MNTKDVVKAVMFNTHQKEIIEMADAHCHLDLVSDRKLIDDSIKNGVRTIITNGVDTKSNAKNLEIADNKNIFTLLGIDPEHANVTDEELEFNVNLIKKNADKITGIGEIGLDYGRVKDLVPIEKQKVVFARFLDLAVELKLPVSIHSRDALEDVFQILNDKNVQMVHMHFFEGNVQQAKEIEKKGYMISVPPIQSGKRSKVIKEIAIDNIMAESDSPVVGLSPSYVERSIGMISEIKKIEFKKAADLLTQNTKRFFKINRKGTFMRY
jgi:TatD DNase family protein